MHRTGHDLRHNFSLFNTHLLVYIFRDDQMSLPDQSILQIPLLWSWEFGKLEMFPPKTNPWIDLISISNSPYFSWEYFHFLIGKTLNFLGVSDFNVFFWIFSLKLQNVKNFYKKKCIIATELWNLIKKLKVLSWHFNSISSLSSFFLIFYICLFLYLFPS